MDKKKALHFLKEALNEITKLKTLGWDNQEYKLWRDKIIDILEMSFGNNSTEYKRFSDAFLRSFSYGHQQEEYLEELTMRETAMKSIIQKYETLGIESEPDSRVKLPLKVFISHGHGEGALLKLERFIRELDVEPIIVKDQPNADRTVDDKVLDYLKDVDFVIIFATGDDVIKGKDIIQPRQNVIHEIGLAQTTHPGKIIYLLEGKAQFPSNINPKVYYRFERNSMDDAFTGIVREMRNWGYLKVGK